MCILFLPTIQLSESNNTSFFIWRTVGFIVAKSQKIVKPMINVLQIKYLSIKKKKFKPKKFRENPLPDIKEKLTAFDRLTGEIRLLIVEASLTI